MSLPPSFLFSKDLTQDLGIPCLSLLTLDHFPLLCLQALFSPQEEIILLDIRGFYQIAA